MSGPLCNCPKTTKLTHFLKITAYFLLIFQVECKQLVTRKHSLESELENYKGEISQLRRKLEEGEEGSSQKMTALERVEYSLRNQLRGEF